MDKERFDRGLAARKAVLGADYVERSLAQADDFNREFQELVTEFAWGLCWGDDTLDRRQRSMLNLGMLAALGICGAVVQRAGRSVAVQDGRIVVTRAGE